ncbi:MAG: hypothetical protein N2439_00820 [Anaerolineae bacterium]|nr:hypothetical protein [Anaerolineae bacterium]
MITLAQRRYMETHAYVPEHLPCYVEAIAGAQPFLCGDYVAYAAADRLIFVGYPLGGVYDEAAWLAALDDAMARVRPRLIAVTAAALPAALAARPTSPPDAYYRLALADVRPDKKLRNLLRRAARALTVHEAARFGPEHERLVAAFLADTPVDADTRFIYERVGRYARKRGDSAPGWKTLAGLMNRARDRLNGLWHRETSPADASFLREGGGGAPLLLEARDAAGRLIAFDIATFGGEYAFYLFNFRSREHDVPGASDLLLARLIELARAAGKRYLNLGLGIHAGVSRFKEKWGATPFLTHVACTWERPRPAWEEVWWAVHE